MAFVCCQWNSGSSEGGLSSERNSEGGKDMYQGIIFTSAELQFTARIINKELGKWKSVERASPWY